MGVDNPTVLFRTFLLLLAGCFVWTGPTAVVGDNLPEIDPVSQGAAPDDSAPGGEVTALDLNYIFQEDSTHIELRDLEVEEFFEESGVGSELSSQRIEAPLIASFSDSTQTGSPIDSSPAGDQGGVGRDEADFVGDTSGEGGIANDDSTWVRTFADTMVNPHDYPSHSAMSVGRPNAGYTSFDNGYIPEFEDELKLVDEVPHVREYAQTDNYSRLPESWRLPPGADPNLTGGHAYNADGTPMYELYPAYEGDLYNRNRSYGTGSYYDSLHGSSYHNPNGPYNYRLGQYDPAINDRLLYEDANFTLEGDIPLVTRKFDPDQAHFKLGNLYFQAISTEVGVLFSDYDGPARFRRGEEDGFLGFAGFRFRAAAQISPSFYFTADAQVIYLIGANEVAIRAGTAGSPFLSLVYRTEIGPWDVRIYDFAGVVYPFQFGVDALERAGRYQFGFAGYEAGTNDFTYDPILYNRAGVEADRIVGQDWRLTLTAEQSDYWRTDSNIEDDHSTVQSVGARVGYEGMEIPFSPWTQYRASSVDYFDTATHVLTAGGHGRLTNRLTTDGMVGTMWPSGRAIESQYWLWRIGLRHEISSRTSHGVRTGRGYFESDFSDESIVSEYVHYYFNHQVNEDTNFYAFAQWSEDEFLTGRLVGGTFDREIYGVRLTNRPCENVSASLGYLFEQRERSTTTVEDERQIFDANLNITLDRRTTSYLRYRFEDAELFNESLYMAGVRRYF